MISREDECTGSATPSLPLFRAVLSCLNTGICCTGSALDGTRTGEELAEGSDCRVLLYEPAWTGMPLRNCSPQNNGSA